MASTRVYVGGLPPDIRGDDLLDVFRRYDPLRVDLKAGFGFIEFREPRDADDAVHDMDGYKLEGRRLIVQPAKGSRRAGEFGGFGGGRGGFDDRGRGGFGGGRGGFGGGGGMPRKGDGYRVEVEGLDSRTSWQDLKDFARGAGNVSFADVFVENGKKMGIIEYGTRDDMENALKKLDDTKLDGAIVRLYAPKGSGGGRSRSRSPPRAPRDRSVSPRRSRSRSRSPRGERKGRERSRSPVKRRSRSPPGRDAPRSPPRDERPRSPVRD